MARGLTAPVSPSLPTSVYAFAACSIVRFKLEACLVNFPCQGAPWRKNARDIEAVILARVPYGNASSGGALASGTLSCQPGVGRMV